MGTSDIFYFMAGMSIGVGFCIKEPIRGSLLLGLGVIFLIIGG
jgi:hypothetical protein